MHPWLVWVDLPGGGLFRVPTYFACLMFGFAFAGVVLRREALREGLPPRQVLDLAMWAVPAVLVGARLAHVLVVAPRHHWEHPLDALQLAYGGFVFYGGLISGAALVWAWARRTGIDAWRLGDVFAPATAFGLMFGRLGCLGAGCCYGKPADWPTGIAVPWAITYFRRGHLPEEWLATPLHPTPLYEILLAWTLFVGLSAWRARGHRTGEVLLGFLAAYGVGRSVIELFRADASRGLYFGDLISTSQLLGLGSAVVALAALAWRRRAPRGESVVG